MQGAAAGICLARTLLVNKRQGKSQLLPPAQKADVCGTLLVRKFESTYYPNVREMLKSYQVRLPLASVGCGLRRKYYHVQILASVGCGLRRKHYNAS